MVKSCMNDDLGLALNGGLLKRDGGRIESPMLVLLLRWR
jgi:hypothetical protein